MQEKVWECMWSKDNFTENIKHIKFAPKFFDGLVLSIVFTNVDIKLF